MYLLLSSRKPVAGCAGPAAGDALMEDGAEEEEEEPEIEEPPTKVGVDFQRYEG